MTASDIESFSLSELLAMASGEDRQAYDHLWLGYTETYGHPALREEIAKTYNDATPQDILCFAGAEEGVYAAMRVLLAKNDHAIVVVPNYQAAESVPLQICEVSGIPMNADDNWSLDLDQLRSLIKPNTKVISINFPNNPTGAVMNRKDFDELIDICRHHGIYLFSDEVYRLVEREESIRLPQVADVYEKGLSLNVMSKAYGLSGLRIGWIMSKDRQLLQQMERYKHYLSICNAAASEKLAIIALKAKDQILKRNRALVNDNAVKLGEFFADFNDLFEWYRPDGGCVGYPRFKGPSDANRFCEQLVEKTGILLLPPKIYRSELINVPQDRFRIGFGRKNIDEGLSVFRDYLTYSF